MKNTKTIIIDLKENPEQKRLIELLESEKYSDKIDGVNINRTVDDPDIVIIHLKKARKHIKALRPKSLRSKRRREYDNNSYVSVLIPK